MWTEGNVRIQILKVLNTEVEKIGDLEKREGDLPKEPKDLTFKITRPSGKNKIPYRESQERSRAEFILKLYLLINFKNSRETCL